MNMDIYLKNGELCSFILSQPHSRYTMPLGILVFDRMYYYYMVGFEIHLCFILSMICTRFEHFQCAAMYL